MQRKKLNIGKLAVNEYSTEECLGMVDLFLDSVIQDLELGLKDHNMGYVGRADYALLTAKSVTQELYKKLSGSNSSANVI